MNSETVELLRELIRNQCVNTHTPESGHEFRSVGTLVDYFGVDGEIIEPIPGRQSLVYRIPGTEPAAPSLALVPHLDVVPADADAWTADPFAAEIVDGYVYGRGAVDMLHMAAAFAQAARPYIQGRLRPRGDLVFAAVADEEGGGRYGARYLVENHWDLVKADNLLSEVAYPKVVSSAAVPVTVGEKGSFFTRLKAVGTPGHGSAPYGADDALRKLVTALSGIYAAPAPVSFPETWEDFLAGLDLEPDLAGELSRESTLQAGIDSIAESDPRFASYLHAVTHLTVSPNQALAGTKSNVIAHLAKSTLDIRSHAGTDREQVNGYLREAMGPVGDEIEIKSLGNNEATHSPAAGPLWDAIAGAVEATEGHRRLLPTLATVATDARFWRRRGTAAYGVGLFDERMDFSEMLSLFHGNDERITTASVDLSANLYERILDGLLNPTPPSAEVGL